MKRKKSVLCEEDFELKTSSILGIGMGLFARKTIYKDDTIGSYTGIVVTDDEAYAEPYNTSHYMLMVCKDCNIVSEGDTASYTRYINHSDEPNTRFVVSTRWKTARIVAIKRILKGQELFIDYGPWFWEATEIEKMVLST